MKTSLRCGSIMLFLFSMFTCLHAQVTLQANGPGDTYELIQSVLGSGTAGEVPDCGHSSFGRHITEVFDSQLNKNVFVFHIHVTPDNDRCNGSTDRQRNEIKTQSSSPANLKGSLNETVTYRWKFKLDAGFIPTANFCHIHQIKAGDGDDGAPLITITPRAGNPQKLQIIHSTGSGGTGGEVHSVNLSSFKGVWVDVVEKVKYSTSGTYEIVIKRVSDGVTLLSYSNSNINMWRDGTTFCRPKWGIYRSLNSISELRDEQVRFADFCIAEGNATCSATLAAPPEDLEVLSKKNEPSKEPAAIAVKVFPNPAENSSTIDLNFKDAGKTLVEVYDMQQRRVAVLINTNLQAGAHRTLFDMKSVPAGTYVLRILHNGTVITKMISKQ
ncbi:T9SS type A sorting domain-containing protein [Chitinophaga sp. CF418]|uniref:T9SS type A sorting domain-containing protein n=1 Tax=Chitinophaga sp. CF418 TaxID=1855287 RepID=UPI00091C17BC|nr:T9SS type A sorting domain-containing protein [Chitinophaga sp. CF418]SHN00355.1 Por secretion system C-terminal sorting domain-containing protein [Chitinophaga sp. CF418]